MNILIRTFVGTVVAFFAAQVCAQNVPAVQISFANPVVANSTFPIVATSIGICRYPYPETEQPPDFVLTGNELDMTIYMRSVGQDTVPNPPCVNRTQTYTGPALQQGTYKLLLRSRFYQAIGAGSFGARRDQGEFIFEVGGAVPVTQIPATSGWSLALLLLGMLGAVRWVSAHSGR